jgi:uncharacterized protein YbaP (TraB family)
MLSILGAIVGFIARLSPDILKLFQDSKDKKHELALLEKQIELQKLTGQTDLDRTIQESISAQQVSVQESYRAELEAVRRNNPWVAAYAATVRPTITYAFFLLYCLVKFAQFKILIDPTLPWQAGLTATQALVAIWNPEDVGLFAAVMTFWFADRTVRRA